MISVQTSTDQVVVSLQDLSTNGYMINGVLRNPDSRLKMHTTKLTTRCAVLRDGDELRLPHVDICERHLPSSPTLCDTSECALLPLHS